MYFYLITPLQSGSASSLSDSRASLGRKGFISGEGKLTSWRGRNPGAPLPSVPLYETLLKVAMHYLAMYVTVRMTIYFSAESSFRNNLVAAEVEMEDLRRISADLKQQGKVKDKAVTEIKRLKGIVSNQDLKVCLRQLA